VVTGGCLCDAGIALVERGRKAEDPDRAAYSARVGQMPNSTVAAVSSASMTETGRGSGRTAAGAGWSEGFMYIAMMTGR
jgi:hypothetical protein